LAQPPCKKVAAKTVSKGRTSRDHVLHQEPEFIELEPGLVVCVIVVEELLRGGGAPRVHDETRGAGVLHSKTKNEVFQNRLADLSAYVNNKCFYERWINTDPE
jgi:hypothetical protein